MIIIIHGENSLRSFFALRGYVDRLKSIDFSIEIRDSEDVEAFELEEFLSAVSLFNTKEKKAIVLKNFFVSKKGKKYVDIINKAHSEGDKVIILYDSGDVKKSKEFKEIKTKDVIDCKKQTKLEMVDWFSKFVDKDNRLSKVIIGRVVEKCNLDVRFAYNELIKLDTYCIEKDASLEDIDELMIGDDSEENIFRMVDILFDGRTKEAFDMFYVCCSQGVSGILILSIIERQIRFIETVRRLTQDGEKNLANIAREAGIPLFTVRKFGKYSEKYSTENIKILYDRLESYDEKIKIGLMDPYLSCELVFFAIESL